MTGLPIRSVQVAVAGLEKELVLKKKRMGNRVYYSLKPEFPEYETLRKLFALIERERIRKLASGLGQRAVETLGFSDELLQLTRKARRK